MLSACREPEPIYPSSSNHPVRHLSHHPAVVVQQERHGVRRFARLLKRVLHRQADECLVRTMFGSPVAADSDLELSSDQ